MVAAKHLIPLYPLFAVVGAGVVLSVWYGARILTKHNDIVINKGDAMQFQTRESPKIYPREAAVAHFHKLNREEPTKTE